MVALTRDRLWRSAQKYFTQLTRRRQPISGYDTGALVVHYLCRAERSLP